MKNKILLIYDFEKLFDVLIEIEKEIGLKIVKLNKTDLSNFIFSNESDYLLLSKKEINNFKRQIVLDKLPIKFLKLLEKINIGFLKQNFSEKSDVKVGRYIVDINSREMRYENKILKIKWLHDVVEGAMLHCFHSGLNRTVGRCHDHRLIGLQAFYIL